MRFLYRVLGGLAATLALSVPAVAQNDFARLVTGQVSVGTTATLIAAQRPRNKIIVTVNAAVACSFGPSGVTASTGFPLQPVAGATLTLDTSAAIYAVCPSTATIGFAEIF